MGSHQSIGSREVQAAVARLAAGIRGRRRPSADLWLLGIANGGIALAHRLALELQGGGQPIRVGTIDISFHRDDIARRPIPKEFAPTLLPGDVTGSSVILVDDVLHTGRTAKAALDELFDHGRPERVELAVLVDRGGRLLPVAADHVGVQLEAGPDEEVAVVLDAEHPDRDAIRVGPARSLRT